MAKTGKTKGQGRKGRSRFWLVLEIACIVVAVFCVVVIAKEASTYIIADNDYKQITEETGREVAKLKKLNGDAVAWVKVDDTRIDYPVAYTPSDPEYYLHRNLKKEYSSAGTPFFGQGSDPGSATTNSMIVYAHHMRDGSMFAELEKFSDAGWGETHSISYTDKSGTYSYRAVAAWHEDLSGSGYWHYWDNVGTLDAKQMNKFAEKVRSHDASYGGDAEISSKDKVLMLSTCSYGTSNERFVVVAVRTGEDKQAASGKGD